MSTISIVIKATVPLPPGPSKAAQLAMAAMTAATRAGEMIRATVGGEIAVSTQADDARLGKSAALASPRAERAVRRRPRGRRPAADKEEDARYVVVDPIAPRGEASAEPVEVEPAAAAEPEPQSQVEAPGVGDDPLDIPAFLRR